MTERGIENLEQELARDRAELGATIDAIHRKLTPGQLVDEVLHHTRDASGDVASKLGRTLSENPIPAAMIAVGLFWLMAAYPKAEVARPDSTPSVEPPPDKA